jgi:hypothetical protein
MRAPQAGWLRGMRAIPRAAVTGSAVAKTSQVPAWRGRFSGGLGDTCTFSIEVANHATCQVTARPQNVHACGNPMTIDVNSGEVYGSLDCSSEY